jgi:hypothetical protein
VVSRQAIVKRVCDIPEGESPKNVREVLEEFSILMNSVFFSPKNVCDVLEEGIILIK